MENSKTEVTIEQLRAIPDFESMSEEELLRLAESIKELALLLNLIPSTDPIIKK